MCSGEYRQSVHLAFPARISTTYMYLSLYYHYTSLLVYNGAKITPPECQKLGPYTDPTLMVMSIEGLSSARQQILAKLCANHKCDVLCMQETHRGPGAVRPRVHGMNIVTEIAHEQYGSYSYLIPAQVIYLNMQH